MREEESSFVVSSAEEAGDLDCSGTDGHGYDCGEGDADDDDAVDDDDDGGQPGGHWKRRSGDGAAQTH